MQVNVCCAREGSRGLLGQGLRGATSLQMPWDIPGGTDQSLKSSGLPSSLAQLPSSLTQPLYVFVVTLGLNCSALI